MIYGKSTPKYQACVIVLCCAALAGCSGARYRWANNPAMPDGPKTTPTVSAYLAPGPSSSGPKLADLSDKAQAALIHELARLSKKPEDFRKNLAGFFASAGKPQTVDETVLDRNIVIAIQPGAYRPADRIVKAQVVIEPKNFMFSGYSLVATQYATIDLDKVDVKTSYSGSAEVNPTLAGSVKGAVDLKTGISQSTEHAYDITDTVPKPTVEIQPCKLVLTEYSEPNQDISGTSLIKVTLVKNSLLTDAPAPCNAGASNGSVVLLDSENDLFKDNKALPPKKAGIAVSAHFSAAEPLQATVSMTYLVRHVTHGQRTPIEDDDDVEFIPGSTGKPAAIVDGGASRKRLWQLCAHNDGVMVRLPDSRSGPLYFDDLTTATELANWIRTTGSWRLKNASLSLNGAEPQPVPPLTACPA